MGISVSSMQNIPDCQKIHEQGAESPLIVHGSTFLNQVSSRSLKSQLSGFATHQMSDTSAPNSRLAKCRTIKTFKRWRSMDLVSIPQAGLQLCGILEKIRSRFGGYIWFCPTMEVLPQLFWPSFKFLIKSFSPPLPPSLYPGTKLPVPSS